MNTLEFILKLHRLPADDELERINCKKAGQPGHRMCGWCDKHDRPNFECACPILNPAP